MPTVVELPNNVEIEFPDGMGYDDIYQAIGRYAKPLGLPVVNPNPRAYIGNDALVGMPGV